MVDRSTCRANWGGDALSRVSFRGWQRSSSSGPWIAIGATALLWAIIHVQYNVLVIGHVLLVGLAFGWVRWVTGSTVSTILLHAALNAVGLTETYFTLRG